MTPVETVLRELLSGIQSARVYFSGHQRVSASAEAILGAVRELDPDRGLDLGMHEGVLVHQGRPLHEASETAKLLVASLSSWGAGGVYIEPDATSDEVTDLLSALALPPVDDPTTPLPRLRGVGLMAEGAVREGAGGPRPAANPDSVRAIERARLGRRATCAVLERAMEDLGDDVGLDLGDVGAAARDMAGLIRTEPDTAISFISMKRQDEYTFTHTVNVTVLCLAASRPFVRDLDSLLPLAQAALLHDVGKVAVPQEVLYKQGSYTPAEWEQMRAHPSKGAEILSRTPGVDDLAVMSAFGHHLRTDGSGYPPLAVPMRPHPFVGLLSVCDVYEALTAERPYKKRMPPQRAMAVILKSAGQQFEARIVRAFVRAIGMFPVGTFVRLSDGTSGLVVGIDPDHPGSPRVRLIGDVDEAPTSDSPVVDLASDEAKSRGLRVAGVLDRTPQIEDLVASCS